MTDKQFKEITILMRVGLIALGVIIGLMISSCTHVKYHDLEYTSIGGRNIKSMELNPETKTVKIKGYEKENIEAVLAALATFIVIGL